MNSSSRSGRYLPQPTGYRAFHPAKLPPDPLIRLDSAMQLALSQADRAVGRLDGSIETLPHPDMFIYMYVRKEAVLSSQIEGTQSSLNDVLAAEARIFSADRPEDVSEVVNYVGAMNYGLVRLRELPVSVRLIKEIHEKLMHGVRGFELRPGEIRTSQNWIGPGGCTLADATFVPPPPHEVANCLGDLEVFLHQDSTLPLLIKIGIAHCQFETIHPFLDGNGRVGRLLITFLLCENKVLQKPVLYLSHYFKQHRTEYYEKLQAVRDHGAWEEWLTFFLKGVETVAEQAALTARSILRMRENHQRLITEKLGRQAGNGYKLLEKLFERPIVSVSDVREIIGSTAPTANSLVTRLTELKILREITGHSRNRRFRFDEYIQLFQG